MELKQIRYEIHLGLQASEQENKQKYASNKINSDKFKNRIKIVSDGSVKRKTVKGTIIAGAGGAYQIITSDGKILKKEAKIVHTGSIAVAELDPILNATNYILENKILHKQGFVSYIDNQYVAYTLKGIYRPNIKHLNKIIQIKHNIKKISAVTKFDIEWIPAHCGINIHDQVDNMANTKASESLEQQKSILTDMMCSEINQKM